MATTLKDLIEAAYSRSTFNDPDKLATDYELIGVVDRRIKALYALAARHNPYYFGKKSAAVTYDGGVTGWPRPGDAELVAHVESGGAVGGAVAANKEISITSFEDREGEMPPRVYQFGTAYYTVGAAGDPNSTDTMVFFYSRRHKDLSPNQATDSTANTLETDWPEQFNDLIVLHVAKYLATKDGRSEEVQLLSVEEQSLLQTFIMHLEHVNYGVKSRWGQRARVVSPRIHSTGE